MVWVSVFYPLPRGSLCVVGHAFKTQATYTSVLPLTSSLYRALWSARGKRLYLSAVFLREDTGLDMKNTFVIPGTCEKFFKKLWPFAQIFLSNFWQDSCLSHLASYPSIVVVLHLIVFNSTLRSRSFPMETLNQAKQKQHLANGPFSSEL